jgi:small ligand-binding sensory domain FIST
VSPTFVPTDKVNADFGNRLGLALRRARGSALVLLRADHVDDGWLEALDQQSRSGQLGTFGGGTVPDADIVAVQDGQILRCPGLALVLAGGLKSSVIASSACRLLSPLLEVSAAEASMILELAGGAALDQLRLAAEQSDPETPILLAIAADQSALSAAGRNLALRPLTGVDPIRGGIQTNEALPLGTKVAFAARDPHAARKDLEAHLRSASRNSAGTAPHFGLYVNCAARGASLYGTANVDSKIIQSHFPQMPFIGFTSAFELAPLNRKVTPHIYTGVLSIFSKPS